MFTGSDKERKLTFMVDLLFNSSFKRHAKILVIGGNKDDAVYFEKQGFKNAISRLNSVGLITNLKGVLKVTENGLVRGPDLLGAELNVFETFTVENWVNNLPVCESKIFRFLLDNQGTFYLKDTIGTAIGYSPTSGGFNNAISRLNSLGLISKENGKISFNVAVSL